MGQRDGSAAKSNCSSRGEKQLPATICQHILFYDCSPRGLTHSSDLHRHQEHISCTDRNGDKALKYIKNSKRKCIKKL